MKWTLVALASARPQPLANGGGSTHELLAWPDGDAGRLRMAIAELRMQVPLARTPGSERWLAVLEGDGIVLRLPRARHRATAHGEPLHCSGDVAGDCRLVRGSVRMFELLAAPGQAVACRVRGDLAFATGGPMLLAVYAHAAPVQVRAGASMLQVPPHHLAWCLHAQALSGMVAGDGALWIEATP